MITHIKDNLMGVDIQSIKPIKQSEIIPTLRKNPDGTSRILVPVDTNNLEDDYIKPYLGVSTLAQDIPKTELQLIQAYRDLAKSSEVDEAIKEICNEALSSDGRKECIFPDFKSDTKITPATQRKIIEAFKYVYHSLFDFDRNGHNYFRQWYVDGRIAFHIAVDKKEKTIKYIQPIDPVVLRKFTIEHYIKENGMVDVGKTTTIYTYLPQQHRSEDNIHHLWNKNSHKEFIYKFNDDSIAWADSGLVDTDNNMILSHLYKAIVPYNNMKMMEESMIIYRIVRAPERRAFYIDVGSMGTSKALQYVNDIKNTFHNKTVFDSSTNSFVNRKTVHSMVEDYYLPRRDGQKGTSIESIGGAENLGVTKDIEYLRDKFYRSLNVPGSRLNPEMQQSMLMLGRVTEMNRDEYRFKRFIDELRKNFITCIEKVLMTELILRNVTTKEEWYNTITKDLFWDYVEDNSFTEIKQAEKLRAKLELLGEINQYAGIYFSREWIKKEVLGFTEEEIEKMDVELDNEKEEDPDQEPGKGDEVEQDPYYRNDDEYPFHRTKSQTPNQPSSNEPERQEALNSSY